MGQGHGRSINVTIIMPSSFVTGLMDNSTQCSFVSAGIIIANENVDLPYFGGPWMDY